MATFGEKAQRCVIRALEASGKCTYRAPEQFEAVEKAVRDVFDTGEYKHTGGDQNAMIVAKGYGQLAYLINAFMTIGTYESMAIVEKLMEDEQNGREPSLAWDEIVARAKVLLAEDR